MATNDTFIQFEEVMSLTGKPRSTLKLYWNDGRFPKPMRLGRRLSWPKSEIDQWLEDRKNNRVETRPARDGTVPRKQTRNRRHITDKRPRTGRD